MFSRKLFGPYRDFYFCPMGSLIPIWANGERRSWKLSKILWAVRPWGFNFDSVHLNWRLGSLRLTPSLASIIFTQMNHLTIHGHVSTIFRYTMSNYECLTLFLPVSLTLALCTRALNRLCIRPLTPSWPRRGCCCVRSYDLFLPLISGL